jgi:hypothetical protein
MAAFGMIGKGGGAVANVDKNLQIWGLYHLIGQTVSVFLLGLDLGDFTVATDGSITVSLVTTGSQTAAWSAAQLIAADGDYGESTTPISVKNGGAAVQVSVPIVVGSPFVSQGQRLRAIAPDDTKTQSGPALGLGRRGNQFAVLIQNTVRASFGTSLTPSPEGAMLPTTFTDAGGTPIAAGAAFSGVYWDTLTDDYSFDSMFCWQINRPYPCTIVSTTSFIEIEER